MLFVHIGRGKAGSTTIQSFAFNSRAFLVRRGVVYPDIGLKRDKHGLLAEAIGNTASQGDRLGQLEAELRRNPEGRYLISAEEFLDMKPPAIRRLVASAGGHQLKAIVYLREYPGWIRSAYSQQVRMGRTRGDFDAFFDDAVRRVSILPMLKRWAGVIGADNIRIGSTDPTSLPGGSLIADLLEAMQIGSSEDHPIDCPRSNVSPPWPTLELHRAITELQAPGKSELIERRLRRSMIREFGHCLEKAGGGVPETCYLTAAQVEVAALLYNSDVAVLNEKYGADISSLAIGDAPARPFLPTFGAVPLRLRRAFLRRLSMRAVRDTILRNKHPEYIAAKRQLWRALSRRFSS
jgi:hypothetical protein